MKTIFPILFALMILASGCREIQPMIQSVNSLPKTDRKVLIEEFTGMGCVGCPAGSADLERLLTLYPNNLVAVSLHSGFFADPANFNANNKIDFRTKEGDEMVSAIYGALPFTNPSASVNRKETETGNLYHGLRVWPGKVWEELHEELQVELKLNRSFDDASRELNFEVEIAALNDLGDDLRVSAYITESGIVGAQLMPDIGYISDYVHKHVLRTIITNPTGDLISSENLREGETVLKDFTFELPAEWDETRCNLIVFVHRNATGAKEVLQAEEIDVI